MTGVIVLGAERSGTSAVTEMIALWGAYAGPPDLLTGPSAHNPRGQWEYEPFWDLLSEIGGFAEGATWWDPAFASRVRRARSDETLVSKARALLSNLQAKDRPWVLKDPALCHFMEFWLPIWGDAAYVITVRHPVDVARSWERRTASSKRVGTVDLLECNLLRWQHMMLSVLRAVEATPRKLFVEYEQLVESPDREARRLAAFLDAEHRVRSEDSTITSMASAIDPSLQRNRSQSSLDETEEATHAQAALYDFLRAKVRDATLPFADDYPMPFGWWDLVEEAEAVLRGS